MGIHGDISDQSSLRRWSTAESLSNPPRWKRRIQIAPTRPGHPFQSLPSAQYSSTADAPGQPFRWRNLPGALGGMEGPIRKVRRLPEAVVQLRIATPGLARSCYCLNWTMDPQIPPPKPCSGPPILEGP